MKPIIFLIFFLLSNNAYACISAGSPPLKLNLYWGDNCDAFCRQQKQQQEEEYNEELREYYQEQQDYINCVNDERIRELENQREDSDLNSNGIWGD